MAKEQAARAFLYEHGQSLDWIIFGDPLVMICKAAARSARAQSLGGLDPIFAVIDRYKIAVEARGVAMRAENDAPECPAAEAKHAEAWAQEWEVFDELITTTPTTVAGMAAMLDYLAVKPYDPEDKHPKDSPIIQMAYESGEYDDEAKNLLTAAASMLRAIGAVS
jgi:hypothetical protein